MARSKPFRSPQIDMEICQKLDRIIEKQRYRGSFASFCETVLDKFADGLLIEVEEKAADTEVHEVHPLSGRRITRAHDQRKTA